MLPSTRRGISYPDLDRHDRPDIPLHIKNLIDALEIDMIYAQGTNSQRLSRPHLTGVFFYETDTTLTFYDDGTNWHQISNLGRYGSQIDVDWIPSSDSSLKTMFSLVVKGGDLSTNRQLKIDALGYIRSIPSAHPQLTVTMTFGGATIFSSMWPSQGVSNSGGPVPFNLKIWLMNKDVTHQMIQFSNDATGFGNNPGANGSNVGVANTAVDQPIVLTGQFSGGASASNQLHLNQLTAQII